MKVYHAVNSLLFLLVSALLLTACSAGGQKESEVTTLIYANLTKDTYLQPGVDQAAVDRFNRTHEDIQIEVRDYFEENGISGKTRLLTEIAAGNIPDIIDFGRSDKLPYERMARKGLLEDLWPYIENDPDLGREGVVEAPLKAAEVDGGLYAVFDDVEIDTLAGAENIVGDRTSWTQAELREAYAAMPPDSTMMDFMECKQDVFQSVFYLSAECYVDWKRGECFFDGDNFRLTLEFINDNFPDDYEAFDGLGQDMLKQSIERGERILSGRQMLSRELLCRPKHIQICDALYGSGGRASFVGYPMEDGSVGSRFMIMGHRLGMSSVCQNKEAVWDFLREMLLPQYESMEELTSAGSWFIPLNRADYERVQRYDLLGRDRRDHTLYRGGPTLQLRAATPEEVERFENFMNSIDKIDLYDNEVYNIAWDVVSAYFAGDKTLDETVELVQNRVGLYVNENR